MCRDGGTSSGGALLSGLPSSSEQQLLLRSHQLHSPTCPTSDVHGESRSSVLLLLLFPFSSASLRRLKYQRQACQVSGLIYRLCGFCIRFQRAVVNESSLGLVGVGDLPPGHHWREEGCLCALTQEMIRQMTLLSLRDKQETLLSSFMFHLSLVVIKRQGSVCSSRFLMIFHILFTATSKTSPFKLRASGSSHLKIYILMIRARLERY